MEWAMIGIHCPFHGVHSRGFGKLRFLYAYIGQQGLRVFYVKVDHIWMIYNKVVFGAFRLI